MCIRDRVCLFRNCIQLEVPKCPGIVTLIDTYTHFEVHVNIPDECASNLCPKIFPIVRKAIFRGVHNATLNLGYYNSSPSPALLCPCDRGGAHIATANREIGYWTCTLNRMKIGELTPLQLLWVDDQSARISNTEDKCLTDCHLSALVSALNRHASKWREIATHLGFEPGELMNIMDKPFLSSHAPQSWLQAMLSEWLQWAPGDSRGSQSYSTIKMLKSALDKSGLAATASNLSSHLDS